MAYKDFSEMPVWQKAFALLLKIYEVTKTYPAEEKYGLVSDMRRAANSLVCEVCNIEMVLVFVCFTYQYDMSKKSGLKPDEIIPSRQIKIDTS